jgi:soluble lytic murein transglycosylase-like protein
MGKLLTNLIAVLLAAFYMSAARADIYGYADEGGAVYLTDSPTTDADADYQLLAVTPVEPINVLNLAIEQAAEDGQLSLSAKGLHYKDEVKLAAADNGVETALLHAVIAVESNYNYRAVSPKGARGLMQLMPFTAKRFGVNNSYDPGQNIQGGARYLAYLLKLFKNDFSLAVAAYNAGEGAVIQYGNKVPPYRETVNYVSKVLGLYKKLRSA